MATYLCPSTVLTNHLVAEISYHSRVTDKDEKLLFVGAVMGTPGMYTDFVLSVSLWHMVDGHNQEPIWPWWTRYTRHWS